MQARSTVGNADIVDMTAYVYDLICMKEIDKGHILLLMIGSTVGFMTMEYDLGFAKDLKVTFGEILAYRKKFAYAATGADDKADPRTRA